MLKAKKVLTKAVAILTCVIMLAGNGLTAFAAEIVTFDPTSFDHFVDEGKDIYAIETPGYGITVFDNQILVIIDPENEVELGVEKDSKIIFDGKVYTLSEYEYDKESGIKAFQFDYAGKVEDFFGNNETDDYISRLGKKILEIYAADNNKSLNYNNHVEYREGDGIRYDMMEALSKTKNVVLDFYFTHNGKHYHATITSAMAKKVYNSEIEVYGPEFILKHFPCEEINYDTK